MMKMSVQQSLLLLLVLVSFSLSTAAQNLEATLQTYADRYMPEKVHLHYDKGAYAPGETVWFKAYLVEGLMPAERSKNFYVDWLDEKGIVLHHTVSPIVDGATNGQYAIPEDYKGKYLQVRAYTRWMMNFDTAFLYSKNIRILSKAGTATTSKPAPVTALQFFAEGGELVAGITNKIAFKATDQWGLPVTLRGSVQTAGGTLIDSFRTVHNGMGFLLLQPQGSEALVAKWKDAKGAVQTTPLPLIKAEGISMQIGIAGTRRQFTINRTANAPDALKKLHLVGTMHQQMVFKADIDLSALTAKKGLIPTENLPSGIVTITLFDAAWNPVAERITFVDNGDYTFGADLQVNHWGLNKRARNELQITVPDSIAANLSIAVTDAALAPDSSSNIVSQLLLTGDIKGYVHNAPAYFLKENENAAQQLDLVMLTNGWRRFKWEDVVKGKLPTITHPRDSSYLALSGKVYGFTPAQLAGSNGNIIVIARQQDSASRMIISPIGSNGVFKESDLIFFDSLSVYYQLQPAKDLKGGEVRFMEERMKSPDYKRFSKHFIAFNPWNDTSGNFRQYMLTRAQQEASDLMKEKMLATVTVRTKVKTPLEVLDEKYASGLFRSGDGYQFDLVNDKFSTSYTSIFQYLTGKVAGLQISGNGSDVSMQWRGSTPTLFLDEMPSDISMISSIPVSDVAYVKVIRPPFVGAVGGGAGGAIAIYTRRGNDVAQSPGKGLNTQVIYGYSLVKEFYSPNYASFDRRNEQPDLRTTLYWNPLLYTAPNKKNVTLSFYNNDVTGAFRVILEGMTRDGRLVHIEQVLE